MGVSIALPITSAAHKWPPSRYRCGTWYLLSGAPGNVLFSEL